LNEAYVPFFGAFGTTWDDAMVAQWSGNPLGMLWPEMDAGLAPWVAATAGCRRQSGGRWLFLSA